MLQEPVSQGRQPAWGRRCLSPSAPTEARGARWLSPPQPPRTAASAHASPRGPRCLRPKPQACIGARRCRCRSESLSMSRRPGWRLRPHVAANEVRTPTEGRGGRWKLVVKVVGKGCSSLLYSPLPRHPQPVSASPAASPAALEGGPYRPGPCGDSTSAPRDDRGGGGSSADLGVCTAAVERHAANLLPRFGAALPYGSHVRATQAGPEG